MPIALASVLRYCGIAHATEGILQVLSRRAIGIGTPRSGAKTSLQMRARVRRTADHVMQIIHCAFRGAPALSVLLMNAAKSLSSSCPRAPVAKRQFSATLGAVVRNGNTRHRSDNEFEF